MSTCHALTLPQHAALVIKTSLCLPSLKVSFFPQRKDRQMALTEEPILSRLHRLDIMLRHLEEIKGSYNRSPKSSGYEVSTPSSGTLTSEGGISSIHSTPKSLEKHCRPIDDVIMETEIKGSLIDRVVHVENRVMKLCVLLEEEIDAQKKKEGKVEKKERRKKGLKGLFQSCVSGKSNANA